MERLTENQEPEKNPVLIASRIPPEKFNWAKNKMDEILCSAYSNTNWDRQKLFIYEDGRKIAHISENPMGNIFIYFLPAQTSKIMNILQQNGFTLEKFPLGDWANTAISPGECWLVKRIPEMPIAANTGVMEHQEAKDPKAAAPDDWDEGGWTV